MEANISREIRLNPLAAYHFTGRAEREKIHRKAISKSKQNAYIRSMISDFNRTAAILRVAKSIAKQKRGKAERKAAKQLQKRK